MSAPEIRFPEFKEPWRPTVAGAAFKHSRARGEADLPIYSVTLDRGMVRRDSLDRHMESDAADGQNLRAQPGDIVYNMMRMWQGAVGVAPEECMVSPAYVVLRPTKETNPQFFNYWFQTSRMLHKLGAYSHGLTKDRLRLYPDDFSKIPLHLPTRAEQDRIAAFFEDIDAKLAALREKADGLRQFKTGLMQRLFSQELRFTREDGSDYPDWDEKPLGKMGRFTGGGTPDTNNKDYWSGDVAWISSSDLSEGNILSLDIKRRITQEAIKSSATQVTPKGAVLIVTRVGIGKCCISPEDVCTSQDFTNFVPAYGLGEFFAYWLLFNQGRLKSLAQGTSIKGITVQDLKSLKVDVPHPDEQEKIASALSALDAKIAAVADEITHMETFKKGLLQKMFV
jgi:type I restriction enzyme S subunit